MKKLTSISLASLALLAVLASTTAAAQPAPLGGILPRATPPAPPGLYVTVVDGLVNLSNKGGSTSFSAGQFGYTASLTQPPVIVPKAPAVQFLPPPTFTIAKPSGNGNIGAKATVDCEVR